MLATASSSHRLETPRAKPPPPLRGLPMNTRSSWRSSSSPLDESHTLLYELPPSAKRIASPPPQSEPRSPTSPRSCTAAARRAKSPPGSRARSATPSNALQGDMEQFGERCRAWYFRQDEEAGRLMTQTLNTLPPAQRAPFARLQASIRSQYHAHIQVQRQAEFAAHISAVAPGQSISAASRTDRHGVEARKERLEKFERFVARWCSPGMPGTKPFFEGLWAVIRLEVVPETLGGAGQRRIEWEIDDAVFIESSGKDFMFESIDILKGVLAFEETPTSKRSATWSRPGSLYESMAAHARSQSQPLSSPTAGKAAITSTTVTKRTRANSDPFCDTPALAAGLPPLVAPTTPPVLTPASEISAEELESALRTPVTPEPPPSARLPLDLDEDGGEDAGYMRVWMSPDLSDQEYLALLKVFPTFISQRPLPRFPTSRRVERARAVDVEEGFDDHGEQARIRFGTGEMWPGLRMRSQSYQGSWWSRFVAWWRHLFC